MEMFDKIRLFKFRFPFKYLLGLKLKIIIMLQNVTQILRLKKVGAFYVRGFLYD